ncbi:anhydro-N-acetylmuramic acid kinase [Pedobacter insulae]|uniref:Anhydro-N-acetylmuramic acid kinase n=1 Tax=Pedobacter insulae TaxID=414048 RepID=A0A1I2SXV4_9SPHI|nr:anhydro-N-acetylmuramic acid kinase [Pedobacter insulae]SFG57695.1 anhydro-N-acetylmuramic acid kinase [Pedobacter insulae]
MNPNISKLYHIAQKSERKIIGLMSGTSLDGLDIALCLCSGSGTDTRVAVAKFVTMPYDSDFRADIKSVFAKKDADLEKVCLLNEVVAINHAALILKALKEWNIAVDEIDLIASHGQTIFHAPKILHGKASYPNGTLQIGDGDHLAVHTGIITIADFRQKHIAAGGEGAPLAVYGDYLVFAKQGENRIMLNIGGIANFTFLPADKDASKVFSTDVGPGNTLMDQFIQANYPDLYFDQDAALACKGNLNPALLHALLENEFFEKNFPKTTGPELFNLAYLQRAQLQSNTVNLTKEDVLATLCYFTASSIVKAINTTLPEIGQLHIYMSGGGMHNPLLVKLLKNSLTNSIFGTTADLAINPDAKEAVLFALLANETIAGSPIHFGDREGVPSVCMGKICLPS